MHCAAKIVEARQRIEEKAEEETILSIAKFEAKYEELQAEVKEKVSCYSFRSKPLIKSTSN